MNKTKIISIAVGMFFIIVCVPPEEGGSNLSQDRAKLDSLRKVRCPRLMSSAAEYYRNRDWKQTVNIYKEITTLDCNEWNPVYAPPQEIYQYYAIAYEQMGKFDSAVFVLLDGLQKLPDDVTLQKRLDYAYSKAGKTDKYNKTNKNRKDYYLDIARENINKGNLNEALEAYENLFKIDPRDENVAIKISDINIDLNDFEQAIRWADKAASLDNSKGFGQKGKVYYYGWDAYRQNPFTTDDRIVATLAYRYFVKAAAQGYRGFSKKDWMSENSKDIHYGKAQWFMAPDKVKRAGKISTFSSDYNWVSDSITENDIIRHNYVKSGNTYNKKIKETPKLPPDLTIEIKFTEPSGNNYLDAEETGTIIVDIMNNGMGAANNLQPSINLKNNIYGLKIGNIQIINVLSSKAHKKIQIPVTAGQNISSEVVDFEINIKEKNGFDLYPPGGLTFETRALVPPLLTLNDVGINDKSNVNGRIDPNEVIEATALIQNRGQGIAKNVIVSVLYGDNVFNAGDAPTSINLDNIKPNEIKEYHFSFFANRQADTDLPITLNIEEITGRYGQTLNAGLSLNKVIKNATQVIIAGKRQEFIAMSPLSQLTVDIEENIPKTKNINKDAVAVVIGNREYSGDVPTVDFAVRDAEYFKEYLIKAFGYREGNIFYYTNATLSNMKVAFNKLKNAVRPNRSDVFVYYSGHGAPDPESKQGYFVPVDADPNYIKETGYPVGDLYALLNETAAKSTTVVIDACFSGSSDQGMILKDISPVFIEIDKSFLTIDNSVVFTSATGEQVSSWYRDKKHSLFTYFFLKAIQGEADTNTDKQLSLKEIKNYIDDNVPYEARKINNRVQTPMLHTKNVDIILVKY